MINTIQDPYRKLIIFHPTHNTPWIWIIDYSSIHGTIIIIKIDRNHLEWHLWRKKLSSIKFAIVTLTGVRTNISYRNMQCSPKIDTKTGRNAARFGSSKNIENASKKREGHGSAVIALLWLYKDLNHKYISLWLRDGMEHFQKVFLRVTKNILTKP